MTDAQQKQKVYVLYDQRAMSGDTDDAAVLESSGQGQKPPSKRDAKMYGGGVLFSYDVDKDGKTLINEKMEWSV